MTTAYTTLLGLALPVEGELTGTWGTTVNDSITQLLDDAIAGTATESVTSGDWTLTDTGSGAPNQARCAILIATGTPGVSRNIIAPARSKGYFVVNQSDAAVVLKGASTTGISIPTNKSALVVWNGSDFVTGVSPSSSGTVTSVAATVPSFLSVSGSPITSSGTLAISLSGTALPVANGGTGATTAATARTNLGATTIGANVLTLANPSAITFPQFNADNTVSALDAASFRTAIGAGSGGGSVTSVAMSVPAFLTVTGSPITSTGTLAVTLSGTALPVANGGTGVTTLAANNVLLGNGTSALQAVAPGTSGNVLVSNGSTWTSAAPATSSSGLTLLSTVTASASATVDIETTFNSTYDVYQLVISGVAPSVNNANFECLMKIGGSYLTTSTYSWQREYTLSNTPADGYLSANSNSNSLLRLASSISNASNSSLNLVVYIFSPASTSLAKQLTWIGSSLNSTLIQKNNGVGYNSETAALTGLRFSMSSGNISTGTFRLYGISKT